MQSMKILVNKIKNAGLLLLYCKSNIRKQNGFYSIDISKET